MFVVMEVGQASDLGRNTYLAGDKMFKPIGVEPLGLSDSRDFWHKN